MFTPSARPAAASSADYRELASVYKQIEAPVGKLAMYTLRASTKALASKTAGDSTYRRVERRLAEITDARNSLGAKMITLLDGAAFKGQPIEHAQARQLDHKGKGLIAQARRLIPQS